MAGRHRWLMLFLGLTLVRGLIYAAAIPPWQSPDETGHFEYIWLLSHLKRLPTRGDVSPSFERELLGSLYEWHYGEFTGRSLPERIPARLSDLPYSVFATSSRTVIDGRFSLAYLWSALFLFPFHSQEIVSQLYLARLSSVLLNVVIVWLAFHTFRELVPARPVLTLLMTAVVVFLPQHTFINSMVGDGVMAELMACLVLYCWARGFRRGFTAWQATGIVLGTLGGMWSKTTAVFLIPLDVGLAAWWLIWKRRRRDRVRGYLVYLFISIFLVGIGVWVWRGSSLGTRVLQAMHLFGEDTLFSRLLFTDSRGLTLGEALLATYDSFWANFGWMALPVDTRWYGAILLLSMLALAGWILGRSREVPSWVVGMMAGAFGTAFAIFLWVALLASRSGYYQYQGRYLFPVLIPYVFLFVVGLERVLSALKQRYGMVLFLLFLIGFDTWCLVGYILPYFVRR